VGAQLLGAVMNLSPDGYAPTRYREVVLTRSKFDNDFDGLAQKVERERRRRAM